MHNFCIKREFASFGGKCPFKCNHCYTFINNFSTYKANSIPNIINELVSKDFNIIYISGFNENFVSPQIGIKLIEELYNHFKCHILFTTRNTFDNDCLKKITEINKMMLKDGKRLFACVSISAYNSYKKLEPCNVIPTPNQRIEFIKKMFGNKIITFLTIRPVCPKEFIPTNEYIDIIKDIGQMCSGIISSGIVLNKDIINKLDGFPKNYSYVEKPIMSCLKQDNLLVKYVNVEEELNSIQLKCKQSQIPFFSGSIEAIQSYL